MKPEVIMRSTIHAEERVNKQDTQRWGVTLHSYINFIGVRLIPFSILHVIHSPVDSAVYTLFFPFVLRSAIRLLFQTAGVLAQYAVF